MSAENIRQRGTNIVGYDAQLTFERAPPRFVPRGNVLLSHWALQSLAEVSSRPEADGATGPVLTLPTS